MSLGFDSWLACVILLALQTTQMTSRTCPNMCLEKTALALPNTILVDHHILTPSLSEMLAR